MVESKIHSAIIKLGMDTKHTTVEAYIESFPKATQKHLKQLRAQIKKLAPTAEESITYRMPTYKLHGRPLVYFAGFEHHIGFYATPNGHEKFAKELSKFKHGKGSVQFPLTEPLPLDLIERIVKFRVNENERFAKPKKASLKKAFDKKTVTKNDNTMSTEIIDYNQALDSPHREVAELLADEITHQLKNSENKVWHGHPVWFIDGNPIVGYSKQKQGIKLMFWSGADFDEPALDIRPGKFKDASVYFNNVAEISKTDLKRWLKKSEKNQWDYKNIVKRKGKLERLK